MTTIDLTDYNAKREAIQASAESLASARKALEAAETLAAAAVNDDGTKSPAEFLDHKAATARDAEVRKIEVERMAAAHTRLEESLRWDLRCQAEKLVQPLNDLADARAGEAKRAIERLFPGGNFDAPGFNDFQSSGVGRFIDSSPLVSQPRRHAHSLNSRTHEIKSAEYLAWIERAETILQPDQPA